MIATSSLCVWARKRTLCAVAHVVLALARYFAFCYLHAPLGSFRYLARVWQKDWTNANERTQVCICRVYRTRARSPGACAQRQHVPWPQPEGKFAVAMSQIIRAATNKCRSYPSAPTSPACRGAVAEGEAAVEALAAAVALRTAGAVAAATEGLLPGVVATGAAIALAHPDTVPTNGICTFGLRDWISIPTPKIQRACV